MVTQVIRDTPCVCEGFYQMHISSPKIRVCLHTRGNNDNLNICIAAVVFHCSIFKLLEIIEAAAVAGLVYLLKQCLRAPQRFDHSRRLAGTEVQLPVSFITSANGHLCTSHSGFQPTQKSRLEAPTPPWIIILRVGDYWEHRSTRGIGESLAQEA